MPAHLQVQEILAKNKLQRELSKNQSVYIGLTDQEFLELIIEIKKSEKLSPTQINSWIEKTLSKHNLSEQWKKHNSAIKNTSGTIPIALDVKALNALAEEVKKSKTAFTQYKVIKYSGAKPNIVINNYAKSKKHLAKTSFAKKQPKTISLATGKKLANNAIKSGFLLTVVISIAFHSLDQLMNDERTWHHFVGGVAVDIVTTAIIAGVTTVTISAISGLLSVAAGPLLIVVAIGVVTWLLTSYLINTSELSLLIADELIKIERQLSKNSSRLMKKIKNVPNNDPIFLENFIRKLSGAPNKIMVN